MLAVEALLLALVALVAAAVAELLAFVALVEALLALVLALARAVLTAAQQQMLERYVDAFWRKDIETIVGLLKREATWDMPPFLNWYRGADNIGRLACVVGGPVIASLCTAPGRVSIAAEECATE